MSIPQSLLGRQAIARILRTAEGTCVLLDFILSGHDSHVRAREDYRKAQRRAEESRRAINRR